MNSLTVAAATGELRQPRAHIMSRWKAASIHFSLSVAIAAALLVLMLALWYPPPYFALMGGAMLVFLIAGCDVVLGPLITLIIFKSGKKGLKFDLAVIGCLQAIAMSYGLYTMFEARPVFTVFNVDRFEIVSAQDIKDEDLAEGSRPEYRSLSWSGPRLVGGVMPADPDEAWKVAAHGDIKAHPRLYVPYEELAARAAERARPMNALVRERPDLERELHDRLAKLVASNENVGYLYVEGLFRDTVAVIDKRSGTVLEFANPPLW